MTCELLVTASPYGMRAAVIGDEGPVAFHVESAACRSLVGDLYAARPVGALRGIDAGIVDIGEGGEAFLSGAGLSGAAPLIVQIACDAHDGKRPRATARPLLAGRLVVLRPGGSGLAFSRRLRWSPGARRALAAALADAEPLGGALTVRAAAAGVAPEGVRAAACALAAHWRALEVTFQRDPTPRRLWSADGLLGRLLRDAAPPGVERVVIDDGAVLAQARGIAERDAPDLLPALAAHEPAPAEPLFERHDCAGRLAAALHPEVALPGGVRLTVEETRALSAIDVDAGRVDAAVDVDAAALAAREIRLRDLGGLIAVDFAGRGAAHRRTAQRRTTQLAVLERALAADRTPHRVLGVTAGGLVEVNRRRFGPSLREALTEPADDALGGRRMRLDAAAHDLAHAARREAARGVRRLRVRAAPALLAALATPGDAALAGWLGTALAPVPDAALPRGRFVVERV